MFKLRSGVRVGNGRLLSVLRKREDESMVGSGVREKYWRPPMRYHSWYDGGIGKE